jgi:hypothetical protein
LSRAVFTSTPVTKIVTGVLEREKLPGRGGLTLYQFRKMFWRFLTV